jgi:SAM-dependent methyltransferase
MDADLVRAIDALDVVSVLDVGCGTGDNLAILAGSSKRYELTGADRSVDALRLAAKRVPAASLKLLDITNGSLAERHDLVMAMQVSEPLLEDATALCNMASSTKKYVLVSTSRGAKQPRRPVIGHRRDHRSIELRSKLGALGLDVVWIRGRSNITRHGDVITALARI